MTYHTRIITALYTIIRKEIIRILRIWSQSLLPAAITTLLYLLIFGKVIGKHIENMEGFDYINFIVPGLIMMAVINNSYMNVTGSFFSSKFQRNVEEMLIAPMPNYVILLGYALGGTMRGLLVGIVVMAVAMIFTNIHITHLSLMLFVTLCSAFIFSIGGFINSLVANKFDDISIIPTFVITPLTYLGGVFYSINMLPPFWQKVSSINPILYMINLFRYSVLNYSDKDVLFSIIALITVAVVIYIYAIYLLRKGTGLRY